MIEARNLRMTFGRRAAVDGVSFRLDPGSVVGFLGPNGAGKTTTMRIVTGYLAPDEGSVHIDGIDVGRGARQARRLIGYLPEAAAGFTHLTVSEFLTSCADIRGLRGQALRTAIRSTAERVELTQALGETLSTLSKGWRQRAWLAQALLHDPPVLILDEPTDGLDPNQKRTIRRLLRSEARRKTILLSTHDLEEAEEICDRAIIIDRGRIVADSTPASLADDRGRLAPAFYRLTRDRERQSD